MIKTDLCIIGGGAGGLSLAAGAAQLGVDVILIEKGDMGGDCLNSGCVPSKALLAAARRAHLARASHKLGVKTKVEIDYAQVRAHVQKTIDTIAVHDSVERFESLGVRVIQEEGSFTADHTIKAGEHLIDAKYTVIATGSSPITPPIPGLEGTPFLTNETLFLHPTFPRHLLVMGGGPIGLEMAQAFHRLGAEVTVVEGFSILGRDDPSSVASLKKILTREGIALREGHMVEKVSHTAEGFTLYCKTKEGPVELKGDHLLVAVGRKPNLLGLNLDEASINHSPKGIEVNKKLQTNIKNIYAIGDVNGQMAFTHAANLQAGVLLQRLLLKLPVCYDSQQIPWATYTDPELAQAGLSEADLNAAGTAFETIDVPLDTNDRALCEGESEGRLKLLLVKGKVKGVTILAPHASDLLPLWLPVLQGKLKFSAISGLTLPYPSRGEWLKKAASTYFGPKLFSKPIKGLVKFLLKF